jgi:NAD(P)-dependent dehydrogenase (short-subunit alcohol dehydrogenase family)
LVGIAGGQSTSIDIDLVVDECEVFLHLGEFGGDLGAVRLQEGKAFLLVAVSGRDELSVTADGLDGHAGGPQLGADGDPIEVELVVAPPAAGSAVDGGDHQAGTFVVAQGVHADPGAAGGLRDGYARGGDGGRGFWCRPRLDFEHAPNFSVVVMTATLITGANKGLGFETARRLIAAGHTIYVGSRDIERGRRAAQQLGARAVQLDVTDDASVATAVKAIEADEGLDVLINNAGIQAELGDNNVVIGAAELTAEVMRQTFETNVFGLVRVLHAFLPLLQRSANPVVVNVSSGLASLTRVTTRGHAASAYPGVAYPASKTAVNMITVQYAKAFPNMRINAVEPGFTKTDLNRNTGRQTVEQGAEVIVRMAQIGPNGPTGGYFDAEGHLPW